MVTGAAARGTFPHPGARESPPTSVAQTKKPECETGSLISRHRDCDSISEATAVYGRVRAATVSPRRLRDRGPTPISTVTCGRGVPLTIGEPLERVRAVAEELHENAVRSVGGPKP